MISLRLSGYVLELNKIYKTVYQTSNATATTKQ